MGLFRTHVPYYIEIFGLPEFLAEPILVFGFQDSLGFHPTQLEDASKMTFSRKLKRMGVHAIEVSKVLLKKRHRVLDIPDQFKASDLMQVVRNYGFKNTVSLDFFDKRADIRHDMNAPIPTQLRQHFNTIIDVGSLEHVFDTRQCLDNLFSMLRLNGYIMLHTPCKGYFNHGLHTFSPECILESLKVNGFELRYVKYSTQTGVELATPEDAADVLIWVVAKKVQEVSSFVIPMQGRWETYY
jgi:hypothetical protein